MRRVVVMASASGNGKTTVGRELAARLGVPFVELDALVHGPGWAEVSDAELRAQLQPILADDGWVLDGSYTRKLGRLVIDAADTIVWLDLPLRVWFPRLVRRSYRRMRQRAAVERQPRDSRGARRRPRFAVRLCPAVALSPPA